MHPVLCHIGPYVLYGHGVMITLALVVFFVLCFQEGVKRGFEQGKLSKLIIWTILAGILGAKLGYILFNGNNDPLSLSLFMRKGFSLHGTLFLGGVVGWHLMGRYGLPRAAIFDMAAPILALCQAIARFGCFLQGCCYGKPVSWGMYFPVHNNFLHPTQLYLIVGSLVIYRVLKRYEKTATVGGEVFLMYLILELVVRIGIDFFRVYAIPVWGGLYTYQWFCLSLLIGVIYVYAKLKSSRRG